MKSIHIVFIFILISASCALGSIDSMLYISPETSFVGINDTFTIEIWVDSTCLDLHGYSLQVVHDPDNIAYISASDGSWAPGRSKLFMPSNVDSSEGWAWFDCAILGFGGVDGPMQLMQVRYMMIDTALPFTVLQFDSTRFYDSAVHIIPHTKQSGYVTTDTSQILEKETTNLPESYELYIYPNPFNSAVTISAPKTAKIEIFDLNGKIVWETPSVSPSYQGRDVRGIKRICVWQPGKSVCSGVYLVWMTVGNRSIAKQVIYLK